MGSLDGTLKSKWRKRRTRAVTGSCKDDLLACLAAVTRISETIRLTSRLDLGQLCVGCELVIEFRELG
jgi:hypothetical protein